jgi:hypothetical protein
MVIKDKYKAILLSGDHFWRSVQSCSQTTTKEEGVVTNNGKMELHSCAHICAIAIDGKNVVDNSNSDGATI